MVLLEPIDLRANPTDGNKGDITVSGGGTSFMINANAVMNADMAQMPPQTAKANLTTATANPQDVSLSTLTAAITYPITDLTTDLLLREQLAGAMLNHQDFAQLAQELQKGSPYGYPS